MSPAPEPTSQGLLIQAEAAEFLRLSPRTLEKKRTSGGGPKFVKLGSRVLYTRAALLEYIAANEVKSTAEAGGRHAS